MNWFIQTRLEWIAEMIRVYGYVNRKHLCRKFRISLPQAANDLREFQKLNPGAIRYDQSARRYCEPSPTKQTETRSEERLLTRREVEALFGISARFLEVSAVRGDSPPMIRVGRSVKYRVADLRDWIEARRVCSTQEKIKVEPKKGKPPRP